MHERDNGYDVVTMTPRELFARIRPEWLVVLLLVTVSGYAVQTLTTKPRLSFDEGFMIEEARNLASYGVLDVATAPNTFSERPHIANSSGITVSLPLAALFYVFGFDVATARAYAIVWMLACIVAAYAFVRRHFGPWYGVAAAYLLASLPPFHNNGRMVMGDIAGMTLMFLTLMTVRVYPFLSGILLGLCMVSRPSVYVFASFAVAVALVVEHRHSVLKPLLKTAFGAAIPVMIELCVYLPGPLSAAWWHDTVLFFTKPTFGLASSQSGNIVSNLSNLFRETTLMYLVALTGIVLLAWVLRTGMQKDRFIGTFVMTYGTLGFLYFLRSPGWFKYLLPLQLWLATLVPAAIDAVAAYAQTVPFTRVLPGLRVAGGVAIAALIVLQSIHLVYYADIYESDDAQIIAARLQHSVQPSETVAFIHAPQVSMFFDASQKYSFFVVNESLSVGKNPLDLASADLPDFIVIPSEGLEGFSAAFDAPHMQRLSDAYRPVLSYGRFNVYGLIP